MKSHPTTWIEERRNDLANLLKEGRSFSQAAAILNVARGSVCWATSRYGINRELGDMSRPCRAKDRHIERWADRKKRLATVRPVMT